jgi:hypothetical protein
MYVGDAFDAVGLSVLTDCRLAYGWDRHIYDLRPDMIQNANILAFTAKHLFIGASTFTRISLICFYYRLVNSESMDIHPS